MHLPVPVAEALAITHATTTHQKKPYLTIPTDSQQVCRWYQVGLAPPQTHHHQVTTSVPLAALALLGMKQFALCTTRHSPLQGYTPLDSASTSSTLLDSTYSSSIFSHCTNNRRYAPPHPSLTTQNLRRSPPSHRDFLNHTISHTPLHLFSPTTAKPATFPLPPSLFRQ